MTMHSHPVARSTARTLVNRFDGSAEQMVEEKLGRRLEEGAFDEALELDQVRREIEKIYDVEGK